MILMVKDIKEALNEFEDSDSVMVSSPDGELTYVTDIYVYNLARSSIDPINIVLIDTK